MTASTMTRGEQLLSAATSGNTPQLEEIFLEMLEGGELGDPNLPAAVEALLASGRSKQANELATMAAEPLEAQGPPAAAFAMLRCLARLHPKEPALRERLLAVAPGAFADHPHGAELIQTLRLEGGRTAGELAEQIEAATTFRPEDVVRHDGGWGLGRVAEFDPLQLSMRVRFMDDAARSFPLLTAGKFLTRLIPGSFDHTGVVDSASLKKLGKADPGELVRQALGARDGRLPLRELKSVLVGAGAVAPSTWTKFWQGARKALQADPYVEVGSGVNGLIVLRDRPVARDAELLDAVRGGAVLLDGGRGALDLPARLAAVRRALADPAGAMAAEGLVAELAGDARVLAPDAAGPRAAIALVLEELVAVGATVTDWPIELATLAERPAEAARALATIPGADDRRTLLSRLRAQSPDGWAQIATQVLQEVAIDDGAYDLVAQACVEEPARSVFRDAAGAAIVASREHPIPALWACGAVLRGVLDAGAPLPDPADCLLRALSELTRSSADAEMAKDRTARDVLRRGRQAIPAPAILGFCAERSAEEIPRLARAVLGCRGIAPKARSDIQRWFSQHHPELFSAEEAARDSDVLWVSPGGLARREGEFDHLMNVEFPKNAADLGEAIAKGDLSENAEYEAARQRQTWLVARAGEMKEQLERAQVIDLANVSADTADVGSGVTIVRDGGAPEQYQILGPWDVDVDRGIISYLSPLGAALLGTRAGETITAELPDGQCRVTLQQVAPLAAFPDIPAFIAPSGP